MAGTMKDRYCGVYPRVSTYALNSCENIMAERISPENHDWYLDTYSPRGSFFIHSFFSSLYPDISCIFLQLLQQWFLTCMCIYIERVTKIVYMSEFDWQVLYKVCVRFKMWWKFILFHYPVIKIIFKIILFRRWKKDKNLWIDFINIYKLSFESEISLYYKIIFVD